MTGMRRFAQNRRPEQTIAVIRSLGYILQPAASGMRTNRRRASPPRFLAAQTLGHCKPLCQRNLTRAALERQRPPRMRGNGLRTAARHPTGSVGSTKRRRNAGRQAHRRGHPCGRNCRRRRARRPARCHRRCGSGPSVPSRIAQRTARGYRCSHAIIVALQRSTVVRVQAVAAELARSTRPLHGDRNKMGIGGHASMNDAASSERAVGRRCRPVSPSPRSAR